MENYLPLHYDYLQFAYFKGRLFFSVKNGDCTILSDTVCVKLSLTAQLWRWIHPWVQRPHKHRHVCTRRPHDHKELQTSGSARRSSLTLYHEHQRRGWTWCWCSVVRASVKTSKRGSEEFSTEVLARQQRVDGKRWRWGVVTSLIIVMTCKHVAPIRNRGSVGLSVGVIIMGMTQKSDLKNLNFCLTLFSR